jgi:putative spermidine/putrescine transport system ATP-binding protein
MMDQAADAPPALRLDRVTKAYGFLTVINELNLTVRRGEFVSILGPSGCGKSTTLRLIAGFEPLSGGRIFLDGACIDHLPTQQRGAVMVFQNYALFPHMRVFDNVAFGMRMRKRPRAEIAARVAGALELTRLEGLGQRYPRELSGGQQQRVALARAVVLSPKLLLLDEPLSNLDAKLRKELRGEFLEVHRAAGTTTILVTHDIEEAFALSDRVAVMNKGRIEQFDAPSEIFLRPRTRFVADFVGHRNIFEGRISAGPQGAVLAIGGVAVPLPDTAPQAGAVRIAIPSHLIRLARGADAGAGFPARLTTLQYQGTRLNFVADLGGMLLHGEMVATPDAFTHRSGDTVHLCWNRDDVIVLPSESA